MFRKKHMKGCCFVCINKKTHRTLYTSYNTHAINTLCRFKKPQHYRVRPQDHRGARGPHRSDGATPIEQPPAVPARTERNDEAEEAVGQRQPHQVGENQSVMNEWARKKKVPKKSKSVRGKNFSFLFLSQVSYLSSSSSSSARLSIYMYTDT